MWLVRKLILNVVIASSLNLLATFEVHAEASDQQAYEAAMKCYVVSGSAYGERKKAGDVVKADFYDQKAHASFDLAVKFGRSLGNSGKQIETDILATQERELPRLMKDVGYNRQSAAVCRALGLL